MDLESRVGQLFCVGIDGTEMTPSLREYLREIRPGGIVLFSRNLRDAAQVRALNEALAASVEPAPFITIDQEGGRVSRLKPIVPPLPSAAELARRGADEIRAYARDLGMVLAALGFNADFAPVVDLSSPGAANLIGDRSFSEDETVVVECARAFIAGLRDAGIASFLKHFPGLGSTDVDSHVSLPVLSREPSELWRRDLLPYRVCGSDAAGIMVGHVACPSFDPRPGIPASLSEPVVTGLIRVRMGYEGITLTDDLEMGAVSGWAPGDLAREALLAGNDMAMFCNDVEKARLACAAVLGDVRAGRLGEDRVDRSLGRILARKRRFAIGGGPAQASRDWRAALAALSVWSIA